MSRKEISLERLRELFLEYIDLDLEIESGAGRSILQCKQRKVEIILEIRPLSEELY